jgi:dTDP-4-amino-4,6-dideoxygalactose transaminase
MEGLALFGGPKALAQPAGERWKRPLLEEKRLIEAMLDRGELTGAGEGIGKQFEDQFADYIGCKHALSFSHGTAALMAAYYAAGVGPGDEVITPAVGYLGSYAGALHLGARPVFADIEADTLLVDPAAIAKKVTSRTRAVNIVHLNGRVCDMDRILSVARHHSLALVDDASHACGAEWNGRRLGNSAHVTCFSLQGVNPFGKPVGAGEGGVACTNDTRAYQRMLAYCHLHRHGLDDALRGGPYEFMDKEVLGLKWRPHPLGMALAFVSLTTLSERNARRLRDYQRLAQCCQRFSFLRMPRVSEKSILGGFYGGISLIYDKTQLGDLPLSRFLSCLVAEGVPVVRQGVGHREYRRALFTERYDLWGRGRGPLGSGWAGLSNFEPSLPSEFPSSEAADARCFSLPSFIDVVPAYYDGLTEALEKIERLYPTLA